MVAIRPPEYFPRLAYAALMVSVERFILADTFQYSRQSYQNRTKVRNPQGWQWVSIPLKGGQHGRPVDDVRIRQVEGWRKRHWKAFEYNYRATPFFEYYENELRPLFEHRWTHLGDLTCATVTMVHRMLGASSTLIRASTLEGKPTHLEALFEREKGKRLLAPEESAFYDAPVVSSIQVLRYEHPCYHQTFEGFEPDMNTLDLLFNYGPEAASILRSGIRIEDFVDADERV